MLWLFLFRSEVVVLLAQRFLRLSPSSFFPRRNKRKVEGEGSGFLCLCFYFEGGEREVSRRRLATTAQAFDADFEASPSSNANCCTGPQPQGHNETIVGAATSRGSRLNFQRKQVSAAELADEMAEVSTSDEKDETVESTSTATKILYRALPLRVF